MAITVIFSTSQVLGAPQNIVLTDASTGSDVNAVSRRIYITNAQGQYLTQNNGISAADTPTYTDFPLADGAVITLQSIISEDMALSIRLAYVDVSGDVVANTTNLVGFTQYNESFYYGLTQDQAQQNQPPPMIMQDSNYYTNKGIFRTEMDSGNNAIELGADITSAQACYSRATYMRLKENDYF